jgi:hypothetical protein
MLRFDHGMSRKGSGGRQDRTGGLNHRSEPIPNELAAAPAIYWSRTGGMCSWAIGGREWMAWSRESPGMRTRWVTERNALTFQFMTNVIKSGSTQLSRTNFVAGG